MFATTTQQVLIQATRNAARHTLVLGALFAVCLIAMAGGDKESVNRPAADGSAAALVQAHGCSSAVADPTHVVVTTSDGVTRYAGQRLTDKAIEQAEFGVDHGLTVHGFCA